MEILDVLIIGAGPHALTLASLLSSPDPGPDPGPGPDPDPGPGSDPDPGPGADPDPDLLPPCCSSGAQRNQETSNKRRCACREGRAGTTSPAPEERPAKPAASERLHFPPVSLGVVDAYGAWAALWERQLTALNIPHLRSHTLVHTDALQQNALQQFVLRSGRSAELHSLPDQLYILDENAFFNDTRLGRKERKRLHVSSLKKSLSFSLPGTKLSVDFFKDQVERYNLDKVLLKGTVEHIHPVVEHIHPEVEHIHPVVEHIHPVVEHIHPEVEHIHPVVEHSSPEVELRDGCGAVGATDRKRVRYFQVHLREGVVLKARQVVMATGPTRAQMANVPSWVEGIAESFPEERLQHTVHLMHQLQRESLPAPDVCVVCEAGQRVMVVGGGLTSAHVVSLALQQGASQVTWVMRKHLQLKQFDVGDVESLVGRYSHVEHGVKMDGRAYLRQFYNERSLRKRLAMIHLARKGGAVTPEAYVHLQPFIQSGRVDVRTYCQVSEASWCYRSQAWSLSLSTGDHWTGDRIWLATGCKLDVEQDPLLSEVMKEFPIQVMDGWPCTSESLRWAEGCPLYLMGQYTALQVGPHAVNLAGGQAAGMRIANDILRRRLQQDSEEASDRRGQKCKTEEYIQQMKGLLWL
ncbi:uncharacterized protein zgc:113276 isoform X2 [Clinocottus analis]|uniref:uncharacterized protein zgc:113276 isoform X2 n=1 Tax=Clinocottus analis TaxID=304258 RepID=UPI0035BFFD4D